MFADWKQRDRKFCIDICYNWSIHCMAEIVAMKILHHSDKYRMINLIKIAQTINKKSTKSTTPNYSVFYVVGYLDPIFNLNAFAIL